MTWPTSLRMLANPRATVRELAGDSRGFGAFLGLLVLEFVLVRPMVPANAAAVMTFDPMGGFAAFYSAFVNYALKPGLLVFAAGALLYYALRRHRKVELWGAVGIVGYAWVPHVLLVAVGVLIAALGFDHVLLPHRRFTGMTGVLVPLKFIIEFTPTVLIVVLGYRDLRAAGESQLAIEPTPARLRYAALAVTIGLLGAAAVTDANQVVSNWERIRPVMPEDQLPGFAVKSLDGREVIRPRDLAGSVTLIDFWATWCGPCVQAMPHLSKLHEELEPRGLRTLSVNVEWGEKDVVRTFAEKNRLPFPVYVDNGTMQQAMKVNTFPTVFLVDEAGNVRHIHVGTTSMVTIRNEVLALLDD